MPSLWKPISESDRNAVFLSPSSLTGQIGTVQLIGPQGNVLEQGRFSGIHNQNRSHWRFNRPGNAYPAGSRVVVNLDRGGGYEYSIASPGRRYDNVGFAQFDGSYSFDANRQFSNAGSVTGMANGASGGGSGGFRPAGPGGVTGGYFSSGVAAPYYLSSGYPDFPEIEWPGVEAADYSYTDPLDFAQRFGSFQSQQLRDSFDLGQEFSLEALNTELRGLQGFAPAAAALSRQQTRSDNLTNQAQRTEQVNQVLPYARGMLDSQRSRAQAYAEGRVPDALQDRALELTTSSRAADAAAYGGFGERSMQARRMSDLMGIESRLQLAQYGDQLLSANLAQDAELNLAPTIYSDTGRQIRVTPEVGAGRLTYEGWGAINSASLLSPAQALSTDVQQQQFITNLNQRVNELNANGLFQASSFNANGIWQSRVGQFNYDVQYLSALQAANQSMLNIEMQMQMQGLENEAIANASQGIQNANEIQGIAGTAGRIPGVVDSIIGGGNVDTSPADRPTTQTPTGDTVGETTSQAPSSTPSSGDISPDIRTHAVDGTTSRSIEAPTPTIPNGVRMAAGSPVPAGYTRVQNLPNGSYTVVPNSGYTAELDRFNNTARRGAEGPPVQVRNAALVDNTIATAASLSYLPLPGFQQIGSTSSGQRIYSLPAEAASGNALAGAESVGNAAALMASLGALSPEIADVLAVVTGELSPTMFMNDELTSLVDQLGHLIPSWEGSSSSSAVGSEDIGELSTLGELFGGSSISDASAFTTTIGNLSSISDRADFAQFTRSSTERDGDSDDTRQIKRDALEQVEFGLYRIQELWPNLSPAQRSSAVGSLAGAIVEAHTGQRLSDQVVAGTQNSTAGPLRVGDVTDLLGQGINGMAVAHNWDTTSTIGRLLGQSTPAGIAKVGDIAGVIGYGPQNASVKIDAEYLSNVGAMAAPEFGVGAMAFNTVTTVPRDYKVIGQTPEGGAIAIPTNLERTSSLTTNTPAPLAWKKGMQIAKGAHPAQRLWDEGPVRTGIRGSAGGSAAVSGLLTLIDNNPKLAGAMTAHSLFKNIRRGVNG